MRVAYSRHEDFGSQWVKHIMLLNVTCERFVSREVLSLFHVTMPTCETKLSRILFKIAANEYDLIIVQ